MKHKILLITTFLLLNPLAKGVNAQPAPVPDPPQSSTDLPQFYAGLSAGFEHLSGKRSEKIISNNAFSESRVFSDNKKFSSCSDIALSGIAGFLWKIPNLPLSIGPEVYLGRGKVSHVVKDTYHDAAAVENRTYTAELKRKLFYGLMVRAGGNFWKEYFGFLSIGIDFSQFMTDRLMLTANNAPLNSNTFRKTKRLSGFVMGIGVEKRFGSMCVGIDLKRITYKQQNFFDTLRPDAGVPGAPSQLTFSARPKVYSLSLRISYLF